MTENPKIPLVLGDFGIATDWEKNTDHPTEIGSLSSIAPERIRESDQKFDFEKHSKGDMYSLGLCFIGSYLTILFIFKIL
ncbi:MAG: hypothetical protein HWD61_11880 [Parachlamydiaceae bacterium]|nr:MAG: hypothetical protein HWD61_11880 [Parachlamydiaceae bacterium]